MDVMMPELCFRLCVKLDPPKVHESGQTSPVRYEV